MEGCGGCAVAYVMRVVMGDDDGRVAMERRGRSGREGRVRWLKARGVEEEEEQRGF